MLNGKTIILGITGSIAAYKAAELASSLVKLHADVHVIMTQNATNFIHPITFETLTGNKCLSDTFDRNFDFQVEHVALGKEADILLIAPATANIIGKIAGGIADDMLTTTVLSSICPKIISPAMNTVMYQNQIVTSNINRLKELGFEVIEPASGRLACGDTGIGKMPEPEILIQYILKKIANAKDLEGKKVLVTAGPTQEALDPVRYITNHSTGKMGYAIAENCMRRGADVTLISGPCSIKSPAFVNFIPVISADEMAVEVKKRAPYQDIIIKAAAVADFRPKNISSEKIKKTTDTMSIELERNEDILAFLGSHKPAKQFICGFSMETQDLVENSIKKLKTKNIDMIVANNLKTPGAGFGTDTNVVTIITETEAKEYSIMSKEKVADTIVSNILSQINC